MRWLQFSEGCWLIEMLLILRHGYNVFLKKRQKFPAKKYLRICPPFLYEQNIWQSWTRRLGWGLPLASTNKNLQSGLQGSSLGCRRD